jgi:hypothetical protein
MRLIKFDTPTLKFGEPVPWPVIDPAYGLNRYGPHDYNYRNFNEIKIAAIGEGKYKNDLIRFWDVLLHGIPEGERPRYDKSFGGLYGIFRLEDGSRISDENFIDISGYTGSYFEKYSEGINAHKEQLRDSLLILVLPDEDEPGLYHKLKRKTINLNIKSQFIKPNTLRIDSGLGYLYHNLALAIYTKAGGVPWLLKEPLMANTCVIGITFHVERKDRYSSGDRTVFGISEITDEFGEHIGATVTADKLTKEEIDRSYRYYNALTVPKNIMKKIIVKTINKYKNHPDKRMPSVVIIHKTSPFSEEEISGFEEGLDEVGGIPEYALAHLKYKSNYRIYNEEDFDARQGLFLFKNPLSGVLWTIGKYTYEFKGERTDKGKTKMGTSCPIEIILSNNSKLLNIDISDIARQILGLTKMRWNTTSITLREPASTYYSRIYGKFVKGIWQDSMTIDFDIEEEKDIRFFL